MRTPVQRECLAVLALRQHELAQTDRGQRVVLDQRGRPAHDGIFATGQLDDLGRAELGWRGIEVERRALVEPAGVRLPDRGMLQSTRP